MSNAFMVSVVVLAYNHEKYVAEALDSVLNQKCGFTFEIVIGEDGSKDNTRAIIREYEKKYPAIIKLLPQEPNKGVMRNYRDALLRCTGKYIAICSADDYWHDPLKLEKQVSFLESNPDYGFIHTDTDYYFQGSGLVEKDSNKKFQPAIPEGDVFEPLFASQFYIVTASVCFLRSCFEKHVSVDEFIKNGFTYEDLATWLELARHTKFKYLDESTATYRLLPDSIAHTSDSGKKLNFLKTHYKIKTFFIEKYRVDNNLVNEFKIAYHKKKFDMAYNWNIYPEVLESFNFLKEHHEAGTRRGIKKTVIQYPFLYNMAKNVKQVAKRKREHSDFS